MTTEETPRTEAGRRLLDDLRGRGNVTMGGLDLQVAAIEREAASASPPHIHLPGPGTTYIEAAPSETPRPPYAPDYVKLWMESNGLVAISRGAYDDIRRGTFNGGADASALPLDVDRLTAIIESRMSRDLAWLRDDGKTVDRFGPGLVAHALAHLYQTGDVVSGLPPLARLSESGSPPPRYDPEWGDEPTDGTMRVEGESGSPTPPVCECGQGCVMPHQHFDRSQVPTPPGEERS